MPLHPSVVHYPIGLLTAALLFYVLYAWTGREAFRTAGWYCHGLGLIGAAAAIVSGVAARSDVTDRIDAVWLDRHQTLGIGTSVYFLLTWLIFLQRPAWLRRRAIVAALSLVGWGLLLITARYGTILVWHFLVQSS
ncbi:MAG: hypothetical protein NZ742_01795 [Acidobacteria bacterium]|nr:hypothetical protein [Acidobacteriota bacterium]MDW7983782.1 DUF2231 domain-containing protein [Acidobacteriota bacterium]